MTTCLPRDLRVPSRIAGASGSAEVPRKIQSERLPEPRATRTASGLRRPSRAPASGARRLSALGVPCPEAVSPAVGPDGDRRGCRAGRVAVAAAGATRCRLRARGQLDAEDVGELGLVEDLPARRRLGGGGHAGAGARDQVLLVGAAQGEEQLRAARPAARRRRRAPRRRACTSRPSPGSCTSKAISLGDGNSPVFSSAEALHHALARSVPAAARRASRWRPRSPGRWRASAPSGPARPSTVDRVDRRSRSPAPSPRPARSADRPPSRCGRRCARAAAGWRSRCSARGCRTRPCPRTSWRSCGPRSRPARSCGPFFCSCASSRAA